MFGYNHIFSMADDFIRVDNFSHYIDHFYVIFVLAKFSLVKIVWFIVATG